MMRVIYISYVFALKTRVYFDVDFAYINYLITFKFCRDYAKKCSRSQIIACLLFVTLMIYFVKELCLLCCSSGNISYINTSNISYKREIGIKKYRSI